MELKKIGWSPYSKKAKRINIGIKNESGQTLASFELEKDKTRDIKKIVNKIKNEYGFDLNPEEKKKKSLISKDIKWDKD